MFPYLMVYSIIVVSLMLNQATFISEKLNPKNKNIVFNMISNYYFLLSILFLFAALRGNGDGDYFNYLNAVKYVTSFDFVLKPINFPFEIGFRVLSYLSNLLGLNPQFVIISMNSLSFYLINRIVSRRSPNKILSLFLFFPIMLLFDMHHSRSAIAMSAGLNFYDSFYEGEYKKSTIFFLIAYSFHKSSIVILLLVLIKPLINYMSKKKNELNFVSHSVIILIIMLLFVVFFDPLLILTNIFNNPITSKIYWKLSSYVLNDQWSYQFSLLDPRLWLSFSIYLYILPYYSNSDRYNKSLIIIQFISVFSMLLLRHSTILLMRVYNFYNIFLIISLPVFVTISTNASIKKSTIFLNRNRYFSQKNFKNILFLLYTLYTIALIYKQVPYKLFFI